MSVHLHLLHVIVTKKVWAKTIMKESILVQLYHFAYLPYVTYFRTRKC